MPKQNQKKKQNKIWERYKANGDKLVVSGKSCPKCGSGVFLAQHNNRESCGKCGYTAFKPKK